MTSFRQIEANRRNSQLSTGPVTEKGKKRSRRNALRHGLTAETVIDTLEDASDYTAFEMAITADYNPESGVARELVLRLASLLWRLRRATAIESGLFKIQARQLLQFRQGRKAHLQRRMVIDTMYRNAISHNDDLQMEQPEATNEQAVCPAGDQNAASDDLTRAFLRLSNLPTYPLDRLSRYEATLWRQACQIMISLQLLDRRKLWDRGGFRRR
ncbi:hypothetical protein QWJ07_11835 [Frankia sp. RB7]|nr:hypothetical protein [Frankia sp. RB7]